MASTTRCCSPRAAPTQSVEPAPLPVLTVVGVLFGALVLAGVTFQTAPAQTATVAAGAAVEGTETRFGVPASALFGVAATASADGAANSAYDSFTSLGGGVLMAAMMLGEVSPGGTGSGPYSLLMVRVFSMAAGARRCHPGAHSTEQPPDRRHYVWRGVLCH